MKGKTNNRRREERRIGRIGDNRAIREQIGEGRGAKSHRTEEDSAHT